MVEPEKKKTARYKGGQAKHQAGVIPIQGPLNSAERATRLTHEVEGGMRNSNNME